MHNFDQWACDYYDFMQIAYGHKFISQFNGQTDLKRILSIIAQSFNTLTEDQFNKGMATLNLKMSSGDFCPTLSDFKSWCVSGTWWSVDEAWSRVCDWSNQTESEMLVNKIKITVLAKKSWDAVQWLVNQNNMKEAYRNFKTIYENYHMKAVIAGRAQEMYMPPALLNKPKIQITEHKQELTSEQEQISQLTQKLIQEGMKFGDAFKKAELTVRGETRAYVRGVQ